MATQRYISTSFWTDKWIRELDPSERYLYMYLLTNPETTIAGVYTITIDRIAFDTGYDERTLRPMLQRFAEAGKAYFYADEWIIIPSWPRHQRIKERDNNRKGIDNILRELPDDVWQFITEHGYDYEYMKDLGRPLKPLHSPLKPLARSSNYSDTDTDTDINTRTTSAQSAVQPQSADDIWGDDEADPPPQVPESVKSINDTMFTTYGRFMNGEEIELAKELIKRHYPARVSKELRTVARSREPPSAPMNYIHSYLKDQNTRSAKKGAGQIITEFEEVEY